MIADDKPTNAKNTNFIRHLRREVAQRKTIILGVNDRENPKKSASTTHMWKKFSETINTLKAAATNRLTAATLSLSEQDGIGVLHATPNLAGDKGREDRRGKFDRKPRWNTVTVIFLCHVILDIIYFSPELYHLVLGRFWLIGILTTSLDLTTRIHIISYLSN